MSPPCVAPVEVLGTRINILYTQWAVQPRPFACCSNPKAKAFGRCILDVALLPSPLNHQLIQPKWVKTTIDGGSRGGGRRMRYVHEITGNSEGSNSQNSFKVSPSSVFMTYKLCLAWDPDSWCLETAVSFLRSAQSRHAQWTQCSLANPTRHSDNQASTESQPEWQLFSATASWRPPPSRTRVRTQVSMLVLSVC